MYSSLTISSRLMPETRVFLWYRRLSLKTHPFVFNWPANRKTHYKETSYLSSEVLTKSFDLPATMLHWVETLIWKSFHSETVATRNYRASALFALECFCARTFFFLLLLNAKDLKFTYTKWFICVLQSFSFEINAFWHTLLGCLLKFIVSYLFLLITYLSFSKHKKVLKINSKSSLKKENKFVYWNESFFFYFSFFFKFKC